jgi:hypothetical protein
VLGGADYSHMLPPGSFINAAHFPNPQGEILSFAFGLFSMFDHFTTNLLERFYYTPYFPNSSFQILHHGVFFVMGLHIWEINRNTVDIQL